MPAHVTLKEIAARAQVSVATVSLALRDNPLISAATRARLAALAAEMGYRPHPYVSAYMSWRRKRGTLDRPTLALLHVYATVDGWSRHRSGSLREIHRGVVAQIHARGFGHAEFCLRAARPARLVEILKTRAITGLVFAPIIRETDRYEFPWQDFSAVQIGTGPASVQLPRVVHDHYQSALEAVRRCAEHGYRAPALLIDGEHDARLQHVWRAGFAMGAEKHGFPGDAVLRIAEARPDFPAFRAWLRRTRPDVIVTNLHELTAALLARLGLSAPRDLGLVSLSVPLVGDPVSGIHQNSALIGAQAVDLLAGALQLHRTGVLSAAITTQVAGQWNPGETLR